MSYRRILPLMMTFVVALLVVPSVRAGSLEQVGATLQLGPLPVATEARDWAMAVPLGLPIGQCRLDTRDGGLRLKPMGNNETWLVVTAHRPGPISGLLEWVSTDGTTRHLAIAAEGQKIEAGQEPALLLSARHGGTPLQRLLRLPVAAKSLAFGKTVRPVAAPDAEGWQLLETSPPARSTEKRGTIHLADGSTVALQVSLLESITTLASTQLPAGWSYEQLMARSEYLRSGDLRAGLAVVGLRSDARVLRRFELVRDARTNRYGFFGREAIPLPAIDPGFPHKLLSVRAYDPAKALSVRQSFLVRLVRDRAFLIDPRQGPVRARQVAGLQFSGAATTSLMKRDRLFAVRRDARSGVRYLRRWQVGLRGGKATLRGRLFETPLRESMGVGELRAFDLQPWIRAGRATELPARESLLLLGRSPLTAKAEAPLSVYELMPRQDGSAVLVSAARRYTSSLAPPVGGEIPSMQWLKSPTIGAGGYPRRLQIGVPSLRSGEIVSLAGVGERFAGEALVTGVRHPIRSAGLSLDPVVFFQAEYNDGSSSVRRRILTRDGLQVRARGRVLEQRIRSLRASGRGRHLYALTDDGSVEAPYAIRLLTNGLPEGTNLPPLVDAGPDLQTVATSGGRATVRLRARLADANGDPLAVRWSAPGVRFANPNARLTRAEFPQGTTQVRVRAREGGKALLYEGHDFLDVTVTAPSAVADTPGLVTALRGVYPNPANPRVSIAFTVASRGPVQIRIYDLSGRLVRQLLNEDRNTGAYDVSWDGTDDQGRTVGSGVYPVRLNAAGQMDTGRAVIVR